MKRFGLLIAVFCAVLTGWTATLAADQDVPQIRDEGKPPVITEMINAWHIPNSSEACSYNAMMRNPWNPTTIDEPVCVYAGVYPVGGATEINLYYRINSGSWVSKPFGWTCNDGSNDYWWTDCSNSSNWWVPGASYGDQVDYYIEVKKTGYTTTYLYNEAAPNKTDTLATAQANPYFFVYPAPTATPTSAPTATPTVLPLINAWHIPNSYEACDYNSLMRAPWNPVSVLDPVCVYAGVYPIGGATQITLHYRVNDGAWSTHELLWTCNDTPNDYWWTSCNDEEGWWVPGAAAVGDRVDYYLEVQKTGYAVTYLYNELAPDKTDSPAVAEADPYFFVYPEPTATPVSSATAVPPTNTPVLPTNTPTALPLINAWHIPNSYEACDYNALMRNPWNPVSVLDPVCIYAGVYPIGGATQITLHYRVNDGAWSTHELLWTCNDDPNDYWWTACETEQAWWVPGAAAVGDRVDYYIEVQKTGYAVTYLYNELAPDKTGSLAVAEADPYFFIYPEPTATPTSTTTVVPPTDTPVPPTATPTVLPLINAWHIPNSSEACDYNALMRTPWNPVSVLDPVCVYAGVYPIGGATQITLHYRVNEGAWSTHELLWTCNDNPNDYWWTACETEQAWWVPGAAAIGDRVDYYIEVQKTGYAVTYLYNELAPDKTDSLAVAEADPYFFIYPEPTATPTSTTTVVPPTDTPVPPTATPTVLPLINAWHIPNSYEACDYNALMRNPWNPVSVLDPVCVYAGVYPIGGATQITLHYRVNDGAWSTHELLWTCNDNPNDYWWTSCNDEEGWWIPGAAAAGDIVEYYIEVHKTGYAITYLYNELAPDKTDSLVVALAEPYFFEYPFPSETPTPLPPTPTPSAPTATPACINDGDANLDGTVTAGDAQQAFGIALGMYSPTFEEFCAADCNADGTVTAGDAQLIFGKALGMSSCAD